MIRANRYFLLTCLVGIAAVVVLLLLYRQLAFAELESHEERSNVALTRIFANSVWPSYAEFTARAAALPDGALAARPEVAGLRADVLALMRGSKVVKVKLYDLRGLTVFSTDPTQIGEDKRDNAGYRSARAGVPASAVTFRDRFDAFEGTLVDRNVVSSYVPIKEPGTEVVSAVFEVYSDVTDLVHSLEIAQWRIVIGVLGTLSALYAILFTIVHRADRTIARQNAQRAADEARIHHQAYHDALTGLPNRASFVERLHDSIRRAEREGDQLGMLFLDLDRFKLVNDGFGHHEGDRVLRAVAKRLQSVVRDTDALFRMGGDEFTILPERLEDPGDAAHLARRVIEALAEPVIVGGQPVIVTTSVGIAVYPRDASTPEKLVKNADAAMYLAKESGRNQCRFYSPELNERALEQLALETELQQAVRAGDFTLHYQPRVSRDGVVVGAEALLRWNHPTRGIVMPGEFIPILEQSGLIETVGAWVIREACAQARAWEDAGLLAPRVSVNIAARQFRSGNLARTVRDALAASGLAPDRLELELTESSLIDTTDATVEALRELKRVGVALAIDDFGTGYSSLAYLKRLPIDYLKIDRSFVQGVEDDARDAAIVGTIAALARNLGLGLVAEGVETAAQAEAMRAESCDELQGYLFARPEPAAALAARLASARGVRRLRSA